MSSLKSFVISDEEDEENFDGVSDLALMLDRRDFSVDGYFVNSKKYPLIGKALLRGKGKAALVEEDEEDTKDIGAVASTPNSSTANLESDNSLDDAVPLGQASASHSVSGDFSRPNRNLDVSDYDHLNILERPSSAPAGPGGSSSKRRRVASADACSPLGRPPANDDDRLRRLKEKIEEQKRRRVEMERQLAAREDELKALQEKRDAEARQWDDAQARMHQEIMQLLTAQMSAKKDSAVAPVIVSTLIAQPHSVATITPEVAPSVEVQRDGDLPMRDVIESPLRPPSDSLPPLPRLPSRSPSRGFPLSHPQVPLLLRFFDLVYKKVVEVYLPAQQILWNVNFVPNIFL